MQTQFLSVILCTFASRTMIEESKQTEVQTNKHKQLKINNLTKQTFTNYLKINQL